MLARIGTLTAFLNFVYIGNAVMASGKIMSAPASTYAQARSIAASRPSTARASVRAMMTNPVSVRASTSLHPVHHFFLADDFLAGPMSTTFCSYLVFHVYCTGTGLDHRADGACDVERAAPAGIDVNQQGQRCDFGNAAHIGENIFKGTDAE